MRAVPHPELLPLPDELRGSRLVLRPYRAGDGAAFFEGVDRDRQELATWVAWVDRYRSVDDAEVYVRRMAGKWAMREALILGIWTIDGRYCGGTGFHGFDWQVPSLELGYFLIRGARGKGYGREAVTLVTQWGLDHLGARRIWAGCDALNERSWRLLEACGYAREAHLHNECRNHHGSLRDTFIYAVTR
jgi:RimJ/RimL family protein N-acetyltransferase